MPRRRRGDSDALNPWPGYVDALSTLLMVIIFVLLVFVLAQAFLSVALTGRDRALDRLNHQIAELTDLLSLERGRTSDLQLSLAGLNRDLATANATRESLARELTGQRDEGARIAADRDALREERDRLSARLADAALQAQSALARNEQLQARVAETAGRTDQAGQETATIAAQLAERNRQLTAARGALDTAGQQTVALTAQLAERGSDLAQARTKLDAATRAAAQAAAQLAEQTRMLADARTQLAQVRAELDRTVHADRETIETRISDIARLNDQLRAVTALRDEMERQARDAAARASTEEQRRAAVAAQLGDEQKLSESARAQVALLTRQVEELRRQVAQVAGALDAAEKSGQDKDAQIANLGSRLNVALASKVEELQRYRSEFFGRLRDVLQNRQDVQVVGDRFVFQSEVLFPAGSADMSAAGQEQIRKLATTLKAISADIPPDIKWILRVDGHADRQPLGRGAFATNWELSAQRAINVVKLLVDEGIPASRLAATGFGEFQPLDTSDTAASYARNRRIELRLTDR